MGSLQESLNRFKKQQEKCQSTLKSIAGSKASNKTTATHPAPRVVPASTLTKPPVHAVKFSNDTERLQHINNIRKSPVGAQIKRVIDLLFEVQTLPVLVCAKLVSAFRNMLAVFCVAKLKTEGSLRVPIT